MAAFAWDAVTPVHRRFLLVDNGIGPVISNLAINGLIAWLIYRNLTQVPLWGQTSIAGDTIATSFLLPLITCLIVTPMARGKVRAGQVPYLARHDFWKWLPHNAIVRGVLIGIVGLAVLPPLTLKGLQLVGVTSMKPWHFIYFKASFAAFEGVLVTPLLALWAISDISAQSPPSMSRVEKLAGVN